MCPISRHVSYLFDVLCLFIDPAQHKHSQQTNAWISQTWLTSNLLKSRKNTSVCPFFTKQSVLGGQRVKFYHMVWYGMVYIVFFSHWQLKSVNMLLNDIITDGRLFFLRVKNKENIFYYFETHRLSI